MVDQLLEDWDKDKDDINDPDEVFMCYTRWSNIACTPHTIRMASQL